jgi:LysR family hydrogen peroxide-inducible transcriptional activator
MNPVQLTTRQLQYIVAVADAGSFSAAARACFVAQPSLSAQVAQAEKLLGARLFERGARKVRCTAAGEQAVERARAALRAIDDVAQAVKWQGMLRIGAIDTVAPYLFAPWLQAVREEVDRPVLPVQAKTNELLAMLRSGQIDAAVLALPAERGLSCIEIGDDPLMLLVPGKEPTKSTTVAALAEREMMLLEEGHCLRDQAVDICRLSGSSINSVLHATSLETLIEMVASGFGSTLVPRLAQARVLKRDDVTLIPFQQHGPCRTLGLVHEPHSMHAEVLAHVARIASRFVTG